MRIHRAAIVAVALLGVLLLLPAQASWLHDLRVWQGRDVAVQEDFLLIPDEEYYHGGWPGPERYGRFYFHLDASEQEPGQSAASVIEVRRVGLSDLVCRGVISDVMDAKALLRCDDLRAEHSYRVTWTVSGVPPESVALKLSGPYA